MKKYKFCSEPSCFFWGIFSRGPSKEYSMKISVVSDK